MPFDPERLARLDRHFATYVDDGRLAGWQLALTLHDEVAHTASYGHRDREAGLPVPDDTVWRIASMTKPIASVCAMTLWEEGLFDLNDPVSRWIPSFADMTVYEGGGLDDYTTVPAADQIRVWQLLSHSAGLTAGFMNSNVVDALYRNLGQDPTLTLDESIDAFAALPLLFQPGKRWGYGISTDVLGRLIEIWSGKSLDEAIYERVTGPLGMHDTTWSAQENQVDRLAALYAPDPATLKAVRFDAMAGLALRRPLALSAGGGLLSTVADYLRFTRMLARGGELDGARILNPRTIALMTRNHLPAGLSELSTGGFSETAFDGMGFGLGFAVLLDPTRGRTTSSAGEYTWGGACSTVFWVDPAEELTAVFMTQLLPSTTHPIRPQLRQLVYSALL